MKGRLIGALWIIIALVLSFFLFGGVIFQPFLALCFMIAAAEIVASMSLLRPNSLFAPQIQLIVLFFAMVFGLEASRFEILLVIIVCALSDVGAFGIGVTLGKHKVKFLSKISPKKSYEGYVAGAVLPLVAFVTLPLLGLERTPVLTAYIIFGGIVAELGDLLGSATKRAIGIKDSNYALLDWGLFKYLEYPLRGHGGYLDRVDSFSLSLAVLAIIRYLASL